MSERSPLLSPRQNSNSEVPENDKPTAAYTVSLARGVVIFSTVFVLVIILSFGVAVITTIQSPIARDLRVTSGASWFTTSYLIAATAVTPISGKLCEIFSIRSYLLVSALFQTIGLVLTAFAPSFKIFLVGRVVCGFGAAAITPIAFILVTKLATRDRWGLYFGLLNCGYTAGIASGAIFGGELEPRIGWRAVFWTQVPFCLVAASVAYFAIPQFPRAPIDDELDEFTIYQKITKIDYLGLVTLIGAVVLLLYSIAATNIMVMPIILAVVSLALFCLIESQWAVDPIVPVAVIWSRPMFFTGIATIGLMCARWEILYYMPSYSIAVRGWTTGHAGLLLIPTNLGFAVGGVVIGLLHVTKSASYYVSTLVCYALFVVEHYAVSRLITSNSDIRLVVLSLFVNGCIAGAILNYNLAHLLFLTEDVHHSAVIAFNAMFRNLSGSVAASAAGGIFVRSLQTSLMTGFERQGLYGRGELTMQLLSQPMLVQRLQGAEHEVAVGSYASTIRYMLSVGCLWALAVMVPQACTGWTPPEDQIRKSRKRDNPDIDGTTPEPDSIPD